MSRHTLPPLRISVAVRNCEVPIVRSGVGDFPVTDRNHPPQALARLTGLRFTPRVGLTAESYR